MPRARIGTLLPPRVDGIWRARVTVTEAQPDGTRATRRVVVFLDTADKNLAKRKLDKLIAELAAGMDIRTAAAIADVPRTDDYAKTWIEAREAKHVRNAGDERRNLEWHALPTIGHLALGDVRPSHIAAVLTEVASKPKARPNRQGAHSDGGTYSQQTVKHVRAAMYRLFDAARNEGLIEANPVHGVKLARVAEVKKRRIILTEDEFSRFVAFPTADLELRMLSLVARCEGGMRTGDLIQWDWADVDCVHFASCTIPRAKTVTPQHLTIPRILAPHLRAWWERAGEPRSGPVFPARSGKRAGDFRSRRGQSFAERLRRELFRAGVHRMPPVEVPATRPGTRTDLGKRAGGTKLAPNPRDPLYYETERTLPVDFHSFRRAFNTALAEAGVNVQHAMHLAGHGDARTHMRYVMQTSALGTIPDAALPKLPAILAVESSRLVTNHGGPKMNPERFQRATQESNLRPTAPEAVALSN